MKHLFIALIAGALITSCVPARKYQELEKKAKECEDDLAALKRKADTYEAELAERRSELEQLQKKFDILNDDYQTIEKSLKLKEREYDKLNHLYAEVEKKYEKLIAGSESEYKLVREQLERTRLELQRKEDELNAKEAKLKQMSKELEQREARVKELEGIIAQQDAVVKALKDKIAEALLAFKDKGLTVEEKNGKVYVSLEAKLLFASGSTKVDKEGKQALIDLAKILEDEHDLEVVVEGHTDTDALRSSAHPKNNWELSVLRATSVVEIMLSNSSMDPKILSASGRSEFHPVDPNDKAKNRRIEVILTPKLDELYKIISNE